MNLSKEFKALVGTQKKVRELIGVGTEIRRELRRNLDIAKLMENDDASDDASEQPPVPEETVQISKNLELLSLPDCAMETVLSFFSYDEIANMRVVCRRFDELCKRRLNKGFRMAERYHSRCLREVKAKLPRRESERRNHPYARHCDILTAIETRISLLSMTFMKFVDIDLCCFIPGKVIDEIFRVLRVIQNDKNPPRAYEVLQELRDISSMAMEYFDDKIVPSLRVPSLTSTPSGRYSSPGSPWVHAGLMGNDAAAAMGSPLSSGSCGLRVPQAVLLGGMRHPSLQNLNDQLLAITKKLTTITKRNRKTVNDTQKQLATYKLAVEDQNKKISRLEKSLNEQEAVIATQREKLKDQDARIVELNHKMNERKRSVPESEDEEDRPQPPKKKIKTK